jgi:hypothetical protein
MLRQVLLLSRGKKMSPKKPDSKTISIVLYGKENNLWLEWYLECKKLFELLGYNLSHFSANSNFFKYERLYTVVRKEKELITKLEENIFPKTFSCYSLNKDYRQAVFDYNMLISRNQENILLTINYYDFSTIDVDSIITTLKKYIVINYGEIFIMDRREAPFMYADKLNADSFYSSLEILKRFN